MTNSILICRTFLVTLIGFASLLGTHSNGIPASSQRVPPDSFLVLSIKAKTIMEKSSIWKSDVWSPLLQNWAINHSGFYELLLDENASGLNLRSPLQLFARLDEKDSPTPAVGLIGSVSDTERLDQTIKTIAESLGLKKKPGKSLRYGKPELPYEIGRKGKAFYVLGFLPQAPGKNAADIEMHLDQLFDSFPRKPNLEKIPAPLVTHFKQSSDCSVYLDGTGLARAFDKFIPKTQNFWLNTILPLMDNLTHRSVGLHAVSTKGVLKIQAIDYSLPDSAESIPVDHLSVLDTIPGDTPFLARLSLSQGKIKDLVDETVDHLLRTLTTGRMDKDSTLPGFDASVNELMQAPSGDFVLISGPFDPKPSTTSEGAPLLEYNPSFAFGIRIANPFSLKQLLSGLNSANSLDALLNLHGLKLFQKDQFLWLSTPHFQRELEAGRSITPLSTTRKEFLNHHDFALDVAIPPMTHSLRKSGALSFTHLKNLEFIDEFSSLSVCSKNKNLDFTAKFRQKDAQGWEVLIKHLGQELIDRKNDGLYLAIARDDFDALALEISNGALLNANDRFGHTPLHYAAFKGNARFVDYLLRNGGNPNTRGRHDSTPLHSAAWGRNMAVAEVLLEDGADVNAATDEGETPAMTAALRGEQDLLEILFALSADPQAKDQHGTNLIDLAAAGGHHEIVRLLREIGVPNNHPLHIAAGLAEYQVVEKLLKKGHSVNDRDAFGATPLLIAVVAGQEKMVDLLLSKGADPHISAKDGYTLMHGAAFSGKKSLLRKGLSFGLEINPRYGPEGITPADVAEDEGPALPYLRSMGGRTAWELGPHR
jgi:ankyrin repeat protein